MGRLSKSDMLQGVHAEALAEFDQIWSGVQYEREMALQDRRFCSVTGAQWEGSLGDQFFNRPKFEVNKVNLSVIRIINEYRNNRITVDFVSKDGKEADELADTCDGLYRADEQDSSANEAYDNAFEEAVTGGYGAYRLRACYEDEYDPEDDRQRIRIEPIFDADTTVFFDLNARRQDKSDAKTCFVLIPMTRDAYREEYDDDPDSWPKEFVQWLFDWVTIDLVYVAEYYRVEEKRERILIFRTIDGKEERLREADADAERMAYMAGIGTELVGEKRVKVRKVRKYILSGSGILEDCGYIAGNCIPIVPVYGKRVVIDGLERCMGHVRLAKDAQRLKNMQLSRLGEISALSPIKKPIFIPEQVAGHRDMWAEDNVKNYPYLLLNAVQDRDGNDVPTGPVGYTSPPEIPPAMAALLQITETDMMDLLGNQQNGEELQPNMSGKAVELVQTRLDMQTAIYVSNFAKGMRRGGEIWLSMARDIYVEDGRKMKSVGATGEMETVELNVPILDPETAAVERQNDLSEARFDVAVDVGPSSSSRKAATVRALTGLMQITTDPQTMQVLSAMAMMNMEGEGIGDVRKWFRKQLVQMGAMEPTDEEAEEMAAAAQNAPPDANAAFLEASAQEAQAKAIKAQADTEYALARAQESKATTLSTLAKIDQDDQKAAIETAKAINGFVQQAQPSSAMNGRG
jgi:hypothetical protein